MSAGPISDVMFGRHAYLADTACLAYLTDIVYRTHFFSLSIEGRGALLHLR